ncbi:unnamed protein product [Periconia digitata]|uniref:Uncharacterized protein n=1 Tax=Periconia digitata TaxID=1303443 RepID=A0A9W4UE16_9PLEO|nr:unnamed protein product [Periconia digitata]
MLNAGGGLANGAIAASAAARPSPASSPLWQPACTRSAAPANAYAHVRLSAPLSASSFLIQFLHLTTLSLAPRILVTCETMALTVRPRLNSHGAAPTL